ncbi:MAG: hypothetical protein E6Q98_16145 [Rhodospirillaceae bacterium]|nr:MAG: hypothetical protein E6Q98_16145 [Rhodospirillaceae bacterium]
MWATIKTGVSALLEALGIIKKAQQDASDAQIKQAGADAQKVASLETAARVARDQAAALVNAPKDDAGTINDLDNGRF